MSAHWLLFGGTLWLGVVIGFITFGWLARRSNFWSEAPAPPTECSRPRHLSVVREDDDLPA